MKRKRNHKTTKNTVAKPPVTRLAIIEGDCNGKFKIITDFTSPQELKIFHESFNEWFHSPHTRIWNIQSFLYFFRDRYRNRVCLLYEDYLKIEKEGKVIPATKQEWETENN